MPSTTGQHAVRFPTYWVKYNARWVKRDIARGPESPAYWANKFLWSAGGRKKSPPKKG